MRDMTPAELDTFYKRHRMPCGCGTAYLTGPSGGFLENIQCPDCGLKLNVDPTLHLYCGQVIFEPPGYRQPELMGFAKLTDVLPFEVRPKHEFTLKRKLLIVLCCGGIAYSGMRVYEGGKILGYW